MSTSRSREVYSPPPETQSSLIDQASSFDHPAFITQKSHRLRTSPVPGEGSTFVPVVKFTSQFTQRNALRGTKPVYGTVAHVEPAQEADIVSLRRTGRREDARIGRAGQEGVGHAWTISITSSSHSYGEEGGEVQVDVEVVEGFEEARVRPRTPLMPEVLVSGEEETGREWREGGVLPPLQGLGGRLLGGAAESSNAPSTQPPSHHQSRSSHPSHQPHSSQQPRPQQPQTTTPLPIFPPPAFPTIPTLAHDRVILTSEDISFIRLKCLAALFLGILFPPLWVLMGWGHALDKFLLPLGYQTGQDSLMMETYRPYRRVASGLAGVVVLGTGVGIVVGGLALGGLVR